MNPSLLLNEKRINATRGSVYIGCHPQPGPALRPSAFTDHPEGLCLF